MAKKTLEQITQDALGTLQWQLLQLLAQRESDRERIAELEAQIATQTAAKEPHPLKARAIEKVHG